jgi:DNA topoisomerase I
MATPKWIHRAGSPKSGFRYTDDRGAPVRAKPVLERIDALRIPPAYTDVHISPSSRAAIQAWGFDARGRRQYRYHARAVERGQLRKYHRVARLGKHLPAIRAAVARDIAGEELTKTRVAAAVVALIGKGHLRVGESRYERENQTFGASTLRKSHVAVNGSHVRLGYNGKRGIPQHHEIRDAKLAAVIRELERTPGKHLFRYHANDAWYDLASRDVNGYLRTVANVAYTAKDFRTWTGTLESALALAKSGPAPNKTQAKKNVVAAIRTVADVLGNTPAISRKSYVHPLVIALYVDRGITLADDLRRARKVKRLSVEESALTRFLDEHFPDRRKKPRTE